MITFNIILGVGTRKLCWLLDKPPGQTVGRVDRRKMPEILLRTVRRDGADPAADTVRWSWPTPTTTSYAVRRASSSTSSADGGLAG
jgi:hypothetical protein